MFKGLFRKSDTAERYQDSGEDLGVFTLSLSGVEDPFDPDPLWDRKYGGQAGIAEQMSGDNDFRLQAAVDGCRGVSFARDTAGRFREQSPVFTDVVVWINGKRWQADAMHGGRRIEALANNLADLHRRKFGRSLPKDRKPNYTVMPDDTLAEETVAFQFGFGVFVPSSWDVLEGTISLTRAGQDGHGGELPQWSFWRNGAQLRRPVGVYRGQDSLLISADHSAAVRSPIWFSHGQGYISINLNTADSERVFTDQEHIVVAKAKEPTKVTATFQCTLEPKGGGGEALTLTMKRLKEPKVTAWPDENIPASHIARPKPAAKKPPPPQPEARATEIVKMDEADLLAGSDVTRIGNRGRGEDDDDSTPISTRYMLKLAGIALLRIDGERYVDGLRDWTIWFDKDGQPVDFEMARKFDTTKGLALAATSSEPILYYRLPKSDKFKPVQAVPCVLATESGGYLELAPAPVPAVYHGILMLNPGVTFPLSPKPLVLGRSNITPDAEQPDLPLELLNHPDGLNWEPGAGYEGAKLNSLNLSRRHVTVQLEKNELRMTMAEGKMPVFIVDADGKSRKTLEPGARRPVHLKPGQQFLIGNYFLRFHEETPKTMLSRDASRMRRRPPEQLGA
jgi:hypothetical protein